MVLNRYACLLFAALAATRLPVRGDSAPGAAAPPTEASASTGGAGPAEDPLAAALRSFKASRTPGREPEASGLGSSIMPLLRAPGAPSGEGPGPGEAAGGGGLEEGAGTGLTEGSASGAPGSLAVLGPAGSAGRSGAAGAHWLLDAYDARGGGAAQGAGDGSAPDGRDQGAVRAPAARADNPLDAFMGAWISPRDASILGTGRGDRGPASIEAESGSLGPGGLLGGAGARAGAVDRGMPGIGGGPDGLSLALLPVSAGASAEEPAGPAGPGALSGSGPGEGNPYLALIEGDSSSGASELAGSPSPPVLQPSSAGGPAPPSAVQPAAPQEQPAANGVIPDFAKPQDNDTYFKGIRKF